MIDPLNDQQVCLVAEIITPASKEPRIVGFATILLHPSTWSITPYCYLEDLFVASDARGLGVGRSLIDEVYRRADSAGWGRVYWNTTDDNYRARTLYDKLARKTDYIQYRRQYQQQ